MTLPRKTVLRDIRTERLLLRRWRASDRAAFATLNEDAAVHRFLGGAIDRRSSDEFVDRIESHWEQHGWGLWAVEVPGVAPFVGYVGLWPALGITDEPLVEAGWRLAPDHWGRGYATEAAHEALRVGFLLLRLEEIVSFTVPANVRSRRVMERIGMVHDPRRDFDHPRVDAVLHPKLVRHVLYSVTRDRWRAMSAEGGGSG